MSGAIASIRGLEAGGHQLDPAGVGAAVHAHARIAGAVELRLGLLGEVVDQRLDVAALVLLVVDRHGAAGLRRSRASPR